MAVQHKNIPDAERHEPKGASTATSGQVMSSVGGSATAFVNPNTLANINIGSTLEAFNATAQTPSALDTPLQVAFGAGTSNANVSVASNGIVTFTTAGLYNIEIMLNVGRANATGIAIVLARMSVNATPISPVEAVRTDTDTSSIPVNLHLLRSFSAADTLKVEIMRDSAGANDGSLTIVDPVLAGWDNVPSSYIKIQKIAGAV